MAFAQRIITSNSAGDQEFTFTFPFIKEEHIKVFVNFVEKNQGTASSEFQVITNTTPNKIRLGTGLSADNTRVEIRRVSSINTVLVDFEDGSTLTAADLDTNSKQSLFIAQELDDAQKQGLSIDLTTGVPTLNSQRLSGVSDPINAQDAVTKNYLERTGSITSTQIADGTIVNADINTSAAIQGSKIVPAFGSQDITTSGTVDGRDVSADGTKLDTIETNAKDDQTAAEIKTLLQSDKLTDSEITAGALDNRYFTETELTSGALDGRYYTEAEADARFYNLASVEEIQSGETWSSADDKVATTAAIDARIIDLVDDIGGFVPIANETSFPNTNPDINDPPGAGTLVSVPLANNLTSNSSGVITIANGTVGNSTVTITGATANSTFAQGFGIIVETTSTLNTYTFHRYVPKATEVTTVASNTTNINTVATNISNVNAVGTNISNVNSVAGNASNINSAVSNASNINAAVSNATNINAAVNNATNINTVAGISANITTVANDGTDIGTVAGISSNVSTVAGISSNVTTVAGISSNVTTVANNNSNVTTVAGNNANITTVAGISSDVTTVANDGTDIGLVAGSISNVNTTAGSIANVNTVAGSIGSVNTVSSNITNVTNASNYLNNFLQLYLGEASSNPTADGLGNALTEGDLYFNTVDKRLRVFNGSVFQNIGEGLIEVAKFATAAFNTLYTASAGSNSIDLGSLAITGAVFSNEAIATNRVSLGKGSGTFNLGGI